MYIISVPFPEQYSGTVKFRTPFSRQHLQNLRWLSILMLYMVADGHFPSQDATLICKERQREKTVLYF